MTGVPSGSAPTATAFTAADVAAQRLPDRGAVGQPPHPHRRVPPPPLTMTGVPSGSAPTATAVTRRRGRAAAPRPGCRRPAATPAPSSVAAAADDDRGAVRQRPDRHRSHLAGVAAQRLPDRGAVGQPPHPHRRPSSPPLTMTGVPSGSAPTATAVTAPTWPRSGSPTGVPSASRHTRTVPSSPPLTMTGVPSGSAPTATAFTGPVWPRSGSPTGVPSASRHTRTVPSSPPLTMTGVPSGSAPTATAFTAPAWPVRTWWPVAQSTVGPAGLPGPVGGGSRDAGGQAAAAELVGGQFELAGPRRPVEGSEVVGSLPVHGGGGPRRAGSCGIEVGHQPRRIDSDQVERILQKLIEPTGGGGVLGGVFAQVAVLPARTLGLAEEHVEQHAFVAGLVPCGEQFVGERLVEQAGDRTGAAVGRRGLEQVVSGRRAAQGIEVGDR